MGRAVGTFLWVWISLDLSICSVSFPEISDRKFIEDCVREHNKARSAANPPASNMLYMTWDKDLAITAREWASRCEFRHNIYLKNISRVHPTLPSIGENIWTGAPPSIFDIKGAMQSWVNEIQHYNYHENSCQHVCGHYTQVVWAESNKVGCAVQLCAKGVKLFTANAGAIFVCNYAPSGNWKGQQPYQLGSACSGCEGTCVDRLCRNKWTTDWESLQRDSNYYWIILVVRPIALILIFVATYTVQYFYPNIFCYE